MPAAEQGPSKPVARPPGRIQRGSCLPPRIEDEREFGFLRLPCRGVVILQTCPGPCQRFRIRGARGPVSAASGSAEGPERWRNLLGEAMLQGPEPAIAWASRQCCAPTPLLAPQRWRR